MKLTGRTLFFPSLVTVLLMFVAPIPSLADTILKCEKGDFKRWFKQESSGMGTPNYKTRIQGEWVDYCTTSYYPLNVPKKFKSDPKVTWTVKSLERFPDLTQITCVYSLEFKGPEMDEFSFWHDLVDFETARFRKIRSSSNNMNDSSQVKLAIDCQKR